MAISSAANEAGSPPSTSVKLRDPPPMRSDVGDPCARLAGLELAVRCWCGRRRRRNCSCSGRGGCSCSYRRRGWRWRCRLNPFSVGYEKRCSRHGCYRHLSWAGYHHWFNDFGRNGRSRSGRPVGEDHGCCENIARLAVAVHAHYTALTAAFLREVSDS
jgi:hypothetical protein